MVLVSARPSEVADRAVPGHWEGDLIIGKQGESAIGTLVERQTRYVLLLDLRDGRLAPQVRAKLARKILELPVHLRRSLTWDRGKEMAEHVRFTHRRPGVFLRSPQPLAARQQRNVHGLLRQYFPKGTDLAVHTATHLDAVAAELNARPRQTLGWLSPSEAFARVVAMTA
jgi:IS30 family transposase